MRGKYRHSWSRYDAGIDLGYYDTTSLSENFNYLAGSGYDSRTYIGVLNASLYSQLFFDFERQDIGDIAFTNGTLPMAFQGIGPGARFVWRLAPQWASTFQWMTHFRSYLEPSQPSLRERNDTETVFYLKLARVWNRELTTYISLSYLNNSSSFGDGLPDQSGSSGRDHGLDHNSQSGEDASGTRGGRDSSNGHEGH